MMVSQLMERKRDTTIAGGGKYLDKQNEEKIEKLGAAQLTRKKKRERKLRRHQIVQD